MTPPSATWITRLDQGSGGLRVAVKDIIDVAGIPTTAGCRAVADRAAPAALDAACLAGTRAAVMAGDAVIVGKANLDELADGISGVNPWFGTPVNPADAARVPGGSSSGCAAAVGHGEADVAVGTDTAGSVRIPAACCGVAGLKTTFGRVGVTGVWALAPSLDTVGPLAQDIAGLRLGLALLAPDSPIGPTLSGPIGRLRALASDGSTMSSAPRIEAALDAALAASGLEVVDLPIPGWLDAARATLHLLGAEAAALYRQLARDHPDGVSEATRQALDRGAQVGHQQLVAARSLAKHWTARFDAVFSQVAALALPVLDDLPPYLDGDLAASLTVRWTAPVNLAGLPALALPIPLPRGGTPGTPVSGRGGDGGRGGGRGGNTPMPGSMQLVGPANSEDGLLSLGAVIEAAVAVV